METTTKQHEKAIERLCTATKVELETIIQNTAGKRGPMIRAMYQVAMAMLGRGCLPGVEPRF